MLIIQSIMCNNGEGEKMKKKLSILAILMLLCSTMVINNNFNVEASSGNGGKGSFDLDFQFIYNISNNLSNVIYDAYDEGELQKGRNFGSKGEHYAADYIRDVMQHHVRLRDA